MRGSGVNISYQIIGKYFCIRILIIKKKIEERQLAKESKCNEEIILEFEKKILGFQ